MPVVWIKRKALTRLNKEVTDKSPMETGGILLGYINYSPDNCDIVVTDAVGPGRNSTHGEFSFTPDSKYHDGAIARRYTSSGRIVTYLGDWHSHPGGRPSLSRRDKATLVAIAEYQPSRARNPIMLIVGTPVSLENTIMFMVTETPRGRRKKYILAELEIRLFS